MSAGPHTLTGTRIRERRMALSRRQADLARAVGISPAYLNLIEHNRRPVSAELVERLAAELEVPADELAEGRPLGERRCTATAVVRGHRGDHHRRDFEGVNYG